MSVKADGSFAHQNDGIERELELASHPADIMTGRGRCADVPSLITRPALVVCSPGRRSACPFADRLRGDANVSWFDRVLPNPGPEIVAGGIGLARERRVRTVVGFGGGSALDVAKCIAALANDPRGMSLLWNPQARDVRLIQVPTTAGSGSEVTP